MPFVFVVDDDESILDSLKTWLTKRQYDVETFTSSANLVDAVREKEPDLVIMDVRLPGKNGMELSREIKEKANHPVKIILTSGDAAALLNYEFAAADGIINKPFQLQELEVKMNKLLDTGVW